MIDDRSAKKSIFVLHQSDRQAKEIDEILERFGYQVSSGSGDLGEIDALKGDSRPHMLLIETSADEKGFISLMKKLRSDPELKEMPVIALVDKDDLGTATDVLDAGCNAFLLKPVDPRVLFQRVQELLEETPRAYKRVLCRAAAEATSGQESLAGEIVEIGEGGAGLLLDRKQEIRDILKLVFSFPRDPYEMIVGVEVIHVEKCGDQFLHGVRFIIIDGQAKERIRLFVQTFMSTGEP